jgi:PAS domain S-box-containing protein
MDERSFQSLLRRTVAIPVALLVLLVIVLVVEIVSLTSALRWVDHAEEVIAQSRELMRNMTEMETGIRGFFLTGDRNYLQPYVADKANVYRELNLLHRLVADESEVQSRLDAVRDLDLHWIEYADQLLQKPELQLTPEEYAKGKELMQQIRAHQVDLLRTEEKKRDNRIRRASTFNRLVIGTAIVLALVIAALLFTITRRALKYLSETYETHLNIEEEKSHQLAESRELYQTTLNSLGDAVISTDAEGIVRYINPVAQQLTGYNNYNEARGRPLHEVARLVEEATRQPISDPVEAASRLGHAVSSSNHIILISRSGEEYPVEMNSAPIVHDSAEVTGVVIVFRDITQRRQTEQTLRASDRLTQAGRMAATIAHEIRNPLDTVSNLLYLLRRDHYPKPDTQQYLSMASEELARITQITSQLLTFHREAHSPVQVDLALVLESVLTLYSPQIQIAGIKVTKHFETHRAVRGFPGELRQVFANLVANAIHSMPNGGRLMLHIYESSLWFNAQLKGIRVTVLDNGSGIPPEVRKNLFAPFYTTKGEAGTGLGLWVTRGIIEKHEGTIHFISTVRDGRSGTAFSIFLPFQQITDKLEAPVALSRGA